MKRGRAKKKPSGKRPGSAQEKGPLRARRKPAKKQRAKRRGIVAARERRRAGIPGRGARPLDAARRPLGRPAAARGPRRLLLAASRDARRVRPRWARAPRRWGGRSTSGLAHAALVRPAPAPAGGPGAARCSARPTAALAAPRRRRRGPRPGPAPSLTPERAICATIVASAGCLIAAQFVTLPRGRGRPARLRRPARVRRAPRRSRSKTPIDAHSYRPGPGRPARRRRWRSSLRAAGGTGLGPHRSSCSGCSASRSSSSSTARPASTPRRAGGPILRRRSGPRATASTPSSPPPRA